MKYILIIGDGMADNPVPSLNNKTPLQQADIPVMDALAAKGEVGNVVNCPAGLPAGSDTAILSIFGVYAYLSKVGNMLKATFWILGIGLSLGCLGILA